MVYFFSSSSLESVSSPVLPVGACAIPRADHGALACASLPHVTYPTAPLHFVEHKDMTLHLYGTGALEAMETSASLHSKQPIRELHFSYMEFEDIAHWMPKLVLICPNVTVSHVIVMCWSCDMIVYVIILYSVHV